MDSHRTDILVLGAGLQGSGIALELARRGIDVTLVDREARPFHRASLRNEGKIHLGLIYANDRSRATAFLQLEGALHFRSIVARWMPPGDEWLALSTPFHYLVAADSVVPAGDLADHYAAVEQRCRERFASDPALDYLGERPGDLFRPLSSAELSEHYAAPRFAAGFATAERALDTDRLGEAIRRAIAGAPRVTFVPSCRATTIVGESGGFRVGGEGPNGPWRLHARQVVNAAWEGRFELDLQLGIAPPEGLLHRLKYRVIGRLPAALHGAPSVSMVLGRYGDVVVRQDGTAFLSWYPVGLLGWSHDVAPPADWDPACRGDVPSEQAREIASRILVAIEAWYPGMGRCEPLLVDAGAIVALGRTDVDDASSALHDRTRIGVSSHGGYHSVDTGKLTTAPLFAVEAADRVESFARGAAEDR